MRFDIVKCQKSGSIEVNWTYTNWLIEKYLYKNILRLIRAIYGIWPTDTVQTSGKIARK